MHETFSAAALETHAFIARCFRLALAIVVVLDLFAHAAPPYLGAVVPALGLAATVRSPPPFSSTGREETCASRTSRWFIGLPFLIANARALNSWKVAISHMTCSCSSCSNRFLNSRCNPAIALFAAPARSFSGNLVLGFKTLNLASLSRRGIFGDAK